MAGWTVAILVLAVCTSVYGDSRFAFPEFVRERESRIVSGWEAEPGQIPFQLSLRMVSPAGGVSACGGTIIHPEWGLTAAHCTATRVTIVIRAGTVNMTRPGAIFETTKYYNHPQYNEAMQSIVQPNDIGLIEFGRSITFNDFIKPVRIQSSADKDRNYDQIRLTASGWGRTWTDGSSPENLNWVYLRGITNEACLDWYSGSLIIQPSTICVQYYNVTSQSSCQGDSGGPLTVIDDDGQITQVGVTSFVSSTGCHTVNPAGFIRPGYYHEWFTQVSGIVFDEEIELPTTTTEPQEPEEDSPEEDSSPDSPEEDSSPESSEEDSSPDSSEEDSSPDSSEEDSSSSSSEEDLSSSEEDLTNKIKKD